MSARPIEEQPSAKPSAEPPAVIDSGVSTQTAARDAAQAPADAATTTPMEQEMDALPPAPTFTRRCEPGTYQGTFSAMSTTVIPRVNASGNVVLELTPIPGVGDQLAVTGLIEGTLRTEVLIQNAPLAATVKAVLDCATHRLDNGELVDATNDSGETVATLEGVYLDSPPSLRGALNAGNWLMGSVGEWSAASKRLKAAF